MTLTYATEMKASTFDFVQRSHVNRVKGLVRTGVIVGDFLLLLDAIELLRRIKRQLKVVYFQVQLHAFQGNPLLYIRQELKVADKYGSVKQA